MNSTSTPERIVWIDCEMTGLNLTTDALVEIALIVTDSELVPLDNGIAIVIKPPAGTLDQMSDVVRAMHQDSGLIKVLASGVSLADAEATALAYVRRWVPEPGKAPLAGNSVGVDKAFLVRDMPALVAHLNYRVIDVSTVKELTRRWYPRVWFAAPKKVGGHRALADIRESIRELRYYRNTVFVPQPGPTSAEAAAIAARFAPSGGADPDSEPAGATCAV